MTYHDYESWGAADSAQEVPYMLESYKGSSIVSWQGNIERQIADMVEKYTANRNFPYQDKLRQFLQIWRKYPISGSINRETLDPLESAADILAVDNWKLSNFFSNLRDQIRRLVASEEELPRPTGDEEPAPGSGGGSMAAPPSTFGPQKEQPNSSNPAGLPDDQLPDEEEDETENPATGVPGGPNQPAPNAPLTPQNS